MPAKEYDEDEFSITFNDKGNGYIVSEGIYQTSFTWTQEETGVSIRLDGDKYPIEVDGNTVTLDDDGTIMVFSKS